MSCYEPMTTRETKEEMIRKADRAVQTVEPKKNNLLTRFLFAIGVLAVTSGCASITHGTKQEITFNPPEHQVCAVSRADGILGSVQTSSPTLTVERSRDPITLDCGDSLTVYEPSINAAAYTSMMWIDFGLVDFATGAAWTYGEKK